MIENTPLVSIIIPVYKAEAYLHKCVDSLLAQTMTDFEVLLVDDGSPDRSGAICDEYAAKDSRIRVFHKENGGVSSARNLGLDNACGEYVMFVDSDDWVGVDYIKDLYGKREGDTLLIQGANNIQKDGSSIVDNFENCSYVNEQLSQFFDIPFYGYPFAKLFKRGVIEHNKIRFDERIHLHEDNIFMLDYLLIVRSVKFISGTNYFYRYILGSLSNVFHPSEECYLYYQRLKSVLNKFNDNFDVAKHKYLNGVIASAYMQCFLNLYYNKVAFSERLKFVKQYRTKEEIRLVVDFYKQSTIKQKISVFLFRYCWLLFDVYRSIGIFLRYKVLYFYNQRR